MKSNRKLTWILFLSITAVFVFFGVIVVNNVLMFDKIWKQTRENKVTVSVKSQKVFNLKTNEDELISLSEKNTFIHYWTTWCKPCVKELKQLDSILENKQIYNFYFISNEQKDVVLKFIKKNNYNNIPFYLVNSKDTTFQVDIFPTTFYKKNEGFLYSKIIGAQDWSHFFKLKE